MSLIRGRDAPLGIYEQPLRRFAISFWPEPIRAIVVGRSQIRSNTA